MSEPAPESAPPDERRVGGIDRDVGQARLWNMESAVERARRHWGGPIHICAYDCVCALKEEREKENEKSPSRYQ